MNRFRRRRIFFRSFRLLRLSRHIKQAVPVLIFMLALNFFCAVGSLNVLESFAKSAGENNNVFISALMLELGAGLSKKETSNTFLTAVFPFFSEKQEKPENKKIAAVTPSMSPVSTASPTPLQKPVETPKPVPTPAPKPAASPKPSAVLSAEGIDFKGDSSGIDAAALLKEPLNIKPEGEPEILIVHTHSTESYSYDGTYKETSSFHTLDFSHSVIGVGEELTSALKEKGFSVIHDKGIYDFPSYSGSYDRSMNSIQTYLKKYSSIKMVLDIHRDAAVDSDGNAVKESAIINGQSVSKIMMVVGMGSPEMPNPHWKDSLKLAIRLNAALNLKYAGVSRPIVLSSERYNEQATSGSLLIEIGSNGNSLEESKASAKLLADAFQTALNG